MDEHDKQILDQITDRDLDCALAHNSLWEFCRILHPNFYKEDREYLRDMADRIEDFVEHSPKHFLVINAPPRFGKSLTAQDTTAWLFGRDPSTRVMTASYNERLASMFSRSVRNMIQTESIGERVVFSDIFPNTAVKYGEAAAQMWTIDGQTQVSYLATSPGGTATGFGCDYLICDDLVRSAEEAYNENSLDDTWSWFTNTMLSRLEGKRKAIIIMTRWGERDLAGRILGAFGDDAEQITYKVQSEDGKLLCESILSAKDIAFLKQEMNVDIFEANYNQHPIDVGGRLYEAFKEWDDLPEGEAKNYTDTADTGSDFLCSINYTVYQDEAYITNLVFTDEPMERTETAVAELLLTGNVSKAVVESNNGGRGFARNVERLLKEKFNTNRISITSQTQTHNKESRILASSSWVQNHVYMPKGWKNRFPEFYKQVMSYQRKGKNAHDDSVDVLAAIYESITARGKPRVITEAELGFGGRQREIFSNGF
ncbi:phage terminase large subunit [Candidatus Saccharibacteria bacterium]|nr:phage terminase large subunit [Candidatus Saccharibacteria bacterium]